MQHLYDWNDLRHFLAAARAGSFLGGARSLGVDQTTTARRVEALEDELAGPLFERHTTGIVLTPLGEQLFPAALQAEEQMYRVLRLAAGEDQHLRGEVRISSADGLMNDFLIPRLVEFKRENPQIVVEVVTGFEQSDLFRRQADVSVRLGARPKQKSLLAQRVGYVGWGLYASREYVHEKWCGCVPRAIDWSEQWAIGLDPDRPRLGPMKWADAVLSSCEIALSAGSIPSQVAACVAGFGIAVLPHIMARSHETLLPLPAPEPAPKSAVWLVVTPDAARQARIRKTMDFIVRVVRRDAALLSEPAKRG